MKKLSNILTFGLIAGGVILEMKIIKKLNVIHKEIMYFESCQGICCKEARDRRWAEELKEMKRRNELEEA